MHCGCMVIVRSVMKQRKTSVYNHGNITNLLRKRVVRGMKATM